MALLTTIELKKRIGAEEFDHTLLSSALAPYAGVRTKIHQLLRNKVIMRVKKGLYVFGEGVAQSPARNEVLANLIYGPSCISLESALAHHGLIPEHVPSVTSVTPLRNKRFETPLATFVYRHLTHARYPHGITRVWLDATRPVLIATPEKALCDYVGLNKVRLHDGVRAAEQFLEQDLRIDRTHWLKLDVKQLIQLNQFYKSKSIEYIIHLMARLR